MIPDPEISVNKLAEYMVSKGLRTRRLLKDRKYPDPDFNIGMYHREAAEAVTAYLADGAVDSSPIEKQIQILSQMAPDKIGTQRRINANIDSLERFLGMLDDIDFDGGIAELGPHKPPKLTIQNVKISVRPEIILRGETSKGKALVGGVKLHFSKNFKMTEDSAGYVSAVVQEHLKQTMWDEDAVIHGPYCKVIDVGSGTVFDGVKSIVQRMKDVDAECQNIAGLWPTI